MLHIIPLVMCLFFPAWEGFGLVAVEAMACERIVVGTDSGGVKEVIGDAGFLVKSRDAQLLSDMILSGLSLSESDKNNLKKLALALES